MTRPSVDGHRLSRNEHGEPVLTITLVGWHSIHRFAYNLLGHQCEFARMGDRILKSQRRVFGKKRWDVMWRMYHGEHDKPRTEPLFDGDEPPPAPTVDPGLSAGQRLTFRQANDILIGRHPLTRSRLHPDADTTATKDSPANRPHTCGTCVHRELRLHNNGTYPKCVAHGGKYITRGATTDVRAWWPACPDYQEAAR